MDIFAGCGGLSEGFAQFHDSERTGFKIALALDNDKAAHETHKLRTFFHMFPEGKVPDAYYVFLRGNLELKDLYRSYPDDLREVEKRIQLWELGGESFPDTSLHQQIQGAVKTDADWVLVGGPPCQAYSYAGRSANVRKAGYEPAADHRHFLYKEYLKILREHRPSVFVMENVPGLLNTKIDGRHVWHRLLEDLIDPYSTEPGLLDPSADARHDGYRVYSLVAPDRGLDIFGAPMLEREEFIVECENYGIPQNRHRVLLLGVRADIEVRPNLLRPADKELNAVDVMGDLPKLRSGLTSAADDIENWEEVFSSALEAEWWNNFNDELGIRKEMAKQINKYVRRKLGRGNVFVRSRSNRKPNELADWYTDERLEGFCNHETKAHMASDIHRYLFASCRAAVASRDKKKKDRFRLSHFPEGLLPNHENVKGIPNAKLSHSNFADRFDVVRKNQPSRTIVSHLGKDGHAYIHWDPTQCRSLTVREAARLQTFPDNYFFVGNRGQQYRQVGNAVPPYLARQIADVVSDLLFRARNGSQ